jgi:hypothetical protein
MNRGRRPRPIKPYTYQCSSTASIFATFIVLPRKSLALLGSGWKLSADVMRDLPRHTVVQVTGGIRDWYRVRLPDGTSGFVSGRLTESVSTAVRTTTVRIPADASHALAVHQ